MINKALIKRLCREFEFTTRVRLSLPRTSWQLCLLAVLGGAFSASLIVLFIWSINSIQSLFLTEHNNYTSLHYLSRLLLPLIGALAIFLFAWSTGYQYVRTGIPFVLHRLKVAYGVIPFRNTLNQFFGGIVSLASGFSVGKEGPAVHLGAACSGYLGKQLNLPLNAIRTLSACGVAGGIAACFNTPIAAVIFVMEVILREYKVHMFIPIMLAAIVGSMITSSVFGPAHEFEFFNNIILDYQHYPWVILLGVGLGGLASLFNKYLIATLKKCQHLHITKRFILAGSLTGVLGLIVPQAMGTDLSAINFFLIHELPFSLLLTLLITKCLLTIIALGLGIPGGIIGPILWIGAISGALGATLVGDNVTNNFALMGMAGFMAATLNAPLAALLAVVELSNQLDIILPAMLVISAACLSSGQFFKNRSIFIMQLNMQNLAYRMPPLEDSLHRIGVLGAMQTQVKQFSHDQDATQVPNIAESNHLMVMTKETENGKEYYWQEQVISDDGNNKIRQHKLISISSKDTLAEAYWLLKETRCGAVYVFDRHPDNFLGMITFNQIRKYLLKGELV